MDRIDHETAQVWREQYDINVELLAHIATGKAKGSYGPAEIAEIEQERDRFKALVDAYEADPDA